MKKIIAWVKANLLVVVFSSLMVISFPTGFFLSSMWSGGIRERRAKEATDLMKKVEGAKLAYQLPPVMPGGEGVEDKRVPNRAVNEYYQSERKKIETLAKTVVDAGLEFNQGKGPLAAAVGRTEHKALIEGLFPKPADATQSSLLTNEFVALLVDKPGRPSVYARMLKEILNAGQPVDPAVMAQRLKAEHTTQLQKLAGSDPNRKLEPQAQRTLDDAMLALRKSMYLQRANEVSVYAGMDIFPVESSQSGQGAAGSGIPREIPTTPPGVSHAFQWQMDYWLIRDLLVSVRSANTRGGVQTRIADSVVKRIESVTVFSPFAGTDPNANSGGDMTGVPTAAATLESLTGLVPTSFSRSVSGRASSMQNPLYDVREAQLVMVVSSARVKELFEAFARTNLMTVIGLELTAIDAEADLERGFYYGDESVVRATVTIETIWLRGWTEGLFPSGVRKRLGLPVPEGEKTDDLDMANGGMDAGGMNPGGGWSPEGNPGGPSEPLRNPRSNKGNDGG